MHIKKQFKIFNRIFGVSLMIKSKKFTGKSVYGIANTTPDNQYVIFLDYDDVSLGRIRILLRQLQEMFNLSDFLIFQTKSNSYHCISFDKVSLDKYIAILNSSECCEKFRKTPLLFGHNQWTLRLSEKEGVKPKFIYTLTSKHNILEKSLAHINIIEKLHNLKINKTNADKNTELIGCKYPI